MVAKRAERDSRYRPYPIRKARGHISASSTVNLGDVIWSISFVSEEELESNGRMSAVGSSLGATSSQKPRVGTQVRSDDASNNYSCPEIHLQRTNPPVVSDYMRAFLASLT